MTTPTQADLLVHVELCLVDACTATPQQLLAAAQQFFSGDAQLPYWQERCFSHADLAAATSDAGRFLASACAHIRVSLPPDRRATCVWHREARAAFHIYALNSEAAAEETAGDDDQDSGGGDHTVASHQWMLPHVEFDGVWESLVLDAGVQDSLLDYAECALHFSDAGVDEKIVSWNRLVLLHGPPGTGKTSLCKALAQKLSIRLAHRYAAAVLLEINAHSLFSKWFSESGKLVLKLFEHIRSMLEQEDCLFCVLIDEVESLTAARQAALSGSEPSDAIRVVNALLTQLDRLKRHPNVLVLTTSNITDAIDTAFVDRADIKQYIGWPSAAAVYDILRSCTVELARKRVVLTGAADGAIDLEHMFLPWSVLVDANTSATANGTAAVSASSSASSLPRRAEHSRALAQIATQCAQHHFSGRTLRKLPFQAFARFCRTRHGVDTDTFLRALEAGVAHEIGSRASMQTKKL